MKIIVVLISAVLLLSSCGKKDDCSVPYTPYTPSTRAELCALEKRK